MTSFSRFIVRVALVRRATMKAAAGAVVLAGLVTPAQAVFVEPTGFVSPAWTVPTTNAQATATGTTYQEWDNFIPPGGPNAPDIGNVNPNGTPNAYDSSSATSGGFNTGGNIYSFSGVITPRAIVPTSNLAGHYLNVLVQVQSRGSTIVTADTELLAALTANGVSVTTLPGFSHTETVASSLGAQGNVMNEIWTFQLPADPATLQLDWAWGVTSASLDVIRVDTQSVSVPEPATILSAAIAAVGLGLLGWRRRRRPQA
jgi:hypothetical protein